VAGNIGEKKRSFSYFYTFLLKQRHFYQVFLFERAGKIAEKKYIFSHFASFY